MGSIYCTSRRWCKFVILLSIIASGQTTLVPIKEINDTDGILCINTLMKSTNTHIIHSRWKLSPILEVKLFLKKETLEFSEQIFYQYLMPSKNYTLYYLINQTFEHEISVTILITSKLEENVLIERSIPLGQKYQNLLILTQGQISLLDEACIDSNNDKEPNIPEGKSTIIENKLKPTLMTPFGISNISISTHSPNINNEDVTRDTKDNNFDLKDKFLDLINETGEIFNEDNNISNQNDNINRINSPKCSHGNKCNSNVFETPWKYYEKMNTTVETILLCIILCILLVFIGTASYLIYREKKIRENDKYIYQLTFQCAIDYLKSEKKLYSNRRKLNSINYTQYETY